MVTHYDLFAGIGGFSIAVDEVFNEPVRHIFCEWEKFPTEVLKKHWPNGEYWGDIADLVKHTQALRAEATPLTANPKGDRLSPPRRTRGKSAERTKPTNQNEYDDGITILTGGFPCQPFSQAGQRRGTADNRYKWPEMFEVIRNVSPDWVIAENVAGLVSWSEGMVLEQVCTDLEGEGYEVWPLVIPAVAVNAPHRRDRIWIVGHAKYARQYGSQDGESGAKGSNDNSSWQNQDEQPARPAMARTDVEDPISQRGRGRNEDSRQILERQSSQVQDQRPSWESDWLEVATELCSLDDGLPARMGDTTISKARHRQEQLKAYGNAIVPQVAIEIMKGIRDAQK